MAALRTLHRATRFQIAPCRRIGTGRGSETGCLSASEQLFCDFRIAREAGPKRRARRRKRLKTGGQHFLQGR